MKDILTHDVRNYNQIARANAELLEGDLQDSNQAEFVKSILRAMDNSTELIQRTRTLGNLISGPRSSLRPVRVGHSLDRSLSVIRNARPDKRILVSWYPMTPAEVLADDLLDQVFINIISNAVKHTEGSEVRLTIRLEDIRNPPDSSRQYWKVTLTDHGKGMSDSLKESASMRYVGTLKGRGLGLSILRLLVIERYSGRLAFADRIAGDWTKGTKVEVWLPKSNSEESIVKSIRNLGLSSEEGSKSTTDDGNRSVGMTQRIASS